MAKLIYCATPSRLADSTDNIMDFVSIQGDAPFHPFRAFPYGRFEGISHVGREQTMKWCLRAIEICDEFDMFGVSEGTLLELVYAIKVKKPIVLHVNEFDQEWREYYKKLGKDYGYPLEAFLPDNTELAL